MNGALGAALVSMVCQLTIGRKKYAGVEAEVQTILAEAEALRARLTGLMTEDVAAFEGVMAAYKRPHETEADQEVRTQAVQAALKQASLIPLETARACAAVIALCRTIVGIGNVNALGDANVGALTALAGLKGAALNVRLNLKSIRDETFVTETEAELNQILANQEALVATIYAMIQNKS